MVASVVSAALFCSFRWFRIVVSLFALSCLTVTKLVPHEYSKRKLALVAVMITLVTETRTECKMNPLPPLPIYFIIRWMLDVKLSNR